MTYPSFQKQPGLTGDSELGRDPESGQDTFCSILGCGWPCLDMLVSRISIYEGVESGRWNSPGTGFRVSGLAEGEGGGSRDTIGLLVIFKQLLQSLQVELVIMIHLVFGGLEGLGTGMGWPTAGSGDVGERALLLQMKLTAVPLPRDPHSPTVVMGWENGTRPQRLAEKRLRPQKMQGENPVSFS